MEQMKRGEAAKISTLVGRSQQVSGVASRREISSEIRMFLRRKLSRPLDAQPPPLIAALRVRRRLVDARACAKKSDEDFGFGSVRRALLLLPR